MLHIGHSPSPQHSGFPQLAAKSWPRNGIDFWILARLEREGLKPVSRGEPCDLASPPEPRSARSFRRRWRKSSGLWATKLLMPTRRPWDRFLADTAYGERWARGMAGSRALRGLGGLRLRPASAEHLAVPRLGHRLHSNRNQPFDEVYDLADRRGLASRLDPRTANWRRLSIAIR